MRTPSCAPKMRGYTPQMDPNGHILLWNMMNQWIPVATHPTPKISLGNRLLASPCCLPLPWKTSKPRKPQPRSTWPSCSRSFRSCQSKAKMSAKTSWRKEITESKYVFLKKYMYIILYDKRKNVKTVQSL